MLSGENRHADSTDPGESNERKRKRPLDDEFSAVPFKNVKLADRTESYSAAPEIAGGGNARQVQSRRSSVEFSQALAYVNEVEVGQCY